MEEFPVLNITLIVLITIAIVNRVKAESNWKDWHYTLLSVGIGAALYAVSLYAPPVVTAFIYVGGAASGIFDVFKSMKT